MISEPPTEDGLATAIVHIVDDDLAVANSLSSLLKSEGLDVQAHESSDAFLDRYDSSRPGCVILDVRMPGMNGLELQKELLKRSVHLPIIMISGHADVRMAVEAMSAGAMTFIEKPFTSQEILGHIRQAVAIDRSNRRRYGELREIAECVSTLTRKEFETLEMIAGGKTNKEIADELNLSIRAVEDRRARVIRKLKVSSRAELVDIYTKWCEYYRETDDQ